MEKDLRDFLSALNDRHVRYLLVGGYAFSVYSEPRATKDLDVFVWADPANSVEVFKAIAAYGAPLDGMSPDDFLSPTSIFQIGLPPNRVDVMQSLQGVTFEEAWERRVEAIIDEQVHTQVISLEDLIRNKESVGREQDLVDVRKLRKVQLRKQQNKTRP